MNEAKNKRLHGRSLVSFVVTLSFVLIGTSGLVLYLAPPGGKARAEGWQFWALGRDGWMAQHIASCAVFLLFGLLHLYLNLRPLWHYVYSKSAGGFRRKWELLLSVALIAFLVVGTLFEIPPWNYLLTGSKHLRGYRAEAKRLHRCEGRGREGHGSGQGRSERPRDGRGRGRRDGRGPRSRQSDP